MECCTVQLLIIRDLSQNREQFCRAFDAKRQVHFRKSADFFFRNAAFCTDQQRGVKQKQPACAAAARYPEKAAEIISAAVSLLIGKQLCSRIAVSSGENAVICCIISLKLLPLWILPAAAAMPCRRQGRSSLPSRTVNADSGTARKLPGCARRHG